MERCFLGSPLCSLDPPHLIAAQYSSRLTIWLTIVFTDQAKNSSALDGKMSVSARECLDGPEHIFSWFRAHARCRGGVLGTKCACARPARGAGSPTHTRSLDFGPNRASSEYSANRMLALSALWRANSPCSSPRRDRLRVKSPHDGPRTQRLAHIVRPKAAPARRRDGNRSAPTFSIMTAELDKRYARSRNGVHSPP